MAADCSSQRERPQRQHFQSRGTVRRQPKRSAAEMCERSSVKNPPHRQVILGVPPRQRQGCILRARAKSLTLQRLGAAPPGGLATFRRRSAPLGRGRYRQSAGTGSRSRLREVSGVTGQRQDGEYCRGRSAAGPSVGRAAFFFTLPLAALGVGRRTGPAARIPENIEQRFQHLMRNGCGVRNNDVPDVEHIPRESLSRVVQRLRCTGIKLSSSWPAVSLTVSMAFIRFVHCVRM